MMRRINLFMFATVIATAGVARATAQSFPVSRLPARILPSRGQPLMPPTIEALRVDFIANSGSNIIYFTGSGHLNPQAQATLAAQANWLRQHPEVSVRIEGHGDNLESRDHALAVGERRAAAARDFLILQGVPAAQLSIISWGKERPAIDSTSVAAQALNRRVVTILLR
jgi:peptidoglycan-associated lipoprotein